MATRRTYVSEMLQKALAEKGIREGDLKPWVRDSGFDVGREYQTIWKAVKGESICRDAFLVRLASCLGIDPDYAILTAHADRAEDAFKKYFLAGRERLATDPAVARGWASLSPESREVIRQMIAHPELARKMVAILQIITE